MMRKHSSVHLFRIGIAIGLCIAAGLSACGDNSKANGDKSASQAATAEFALYALSRGKGVPEPTRDALHKARTFLEAARQRGEVLALKETRIGLEGETRLCVEARNAALARDLQRKVRALAGNVELFNIVEEPCSKK